jgi:hypothetical protein
MVSTTLLAKRTRDTRVSRCSSQSPSLNAHAIILIAPAILIFREFLFKNAPHRDHPVLQVFTFGEDDLQLMVLGKVGYNFEDGTSHEREWVGRYEIVKDHDGKLKFKKVQIILVSHAYVVLLAGEI